MKMHNSTLDSETTHSKCKQKKSHFSQEKWESYLQCLKPIR